MTLFRIMMDKPSVTEQNSDGRVYVKHLKSGGAFIPIICVHVSQSNVFTPHSLLGRIHHFICQHTES